MLNALPFIYREPVTPPIFVGRELEISCLKEAILHNSSSVSVSGFDAIGKSSLIRSVLNEITFDKSNKPCGIYSIQIQEHQLYAIIKGDFFSVVIQELCASIWRQLFNRRYSELLEESLLYSRGNDVCGKNEELLKRIYRVVSSTNLAAIGKRSSEIGGKLVLEARVNEENLLSSGRKPLQAFEFMLLIDELMEVLGDYGYSRIIVACAELNHCPPKSDYGLFNEYLGVLSSKGIMFIVSAIDIDRTHFRPEAERVGILLESFETKIKLLPFPDPSLIEQLVKNTLVSNTNGEIEFEINSFDRIFEITEGFPWFAATLCNSAYNLASTLKLKKVDLDVIGKFDVPVSKALINYKRDDGVLNRSQYLRGLGTF